MDEVPGTGLENGQPVSSDCRPGAVAQVTVFD